MDSLKFSEITLNKEIIKNWSFYTLDKHDNHRLYFKPDREEKAGFTFAFISFSTSNGVQNPWSNDPDFEVNASIYGYARFDGLRHMWASGDDGSNNNLDQNKGDSYFYYPDTTVLISLFEHLKTLEQVL